MLHRSAMIVNEENEMQYKSEFDAIPWQAPMTGVRHKYFDQNGIRLRLVEFSKRICPSIGAKKGISDT